MPSLGLPEGGSGAERGRRFPALLPDHDPATKDYIARRIAEGKSHRDIRRSVKRALARRLYRKIEAAVRLQYLTVAP